MIFISARRTGIIRWVIFRSSASSTARRSKAARPPAPPCPEGLCARNLFVGQRIPLAGVAHQVGTVRFGNDPKTSALDRNCKAYDLDNLYVADGSIFCSSGAVNPSFTVMS